MPSALRDSRACRPTKPMPRYQADGSGRDVIVAFSGELNPPHFSHFSENRPVHLPSRNKMVNAKVPATSKFVPDGSGRDLFQQQNTDYVLPVKNCIRQEVVVPKKRNISNYTRPKVAPKFHPTGSGRDMSYTNIDVCRTTTNQHSFKILRPTASNPQILRPRTSPPPRFVSSGSGRDTFQNTRSNRPASSYHPDREGFMYGSQSISRNARYKYGKSSRSCASQNQTMRRLCSPSKNSTMVRAKSASAARTSKRSSYNNNDDTFDDYFRS